MISNAASSDLLDLVTGANRAAFDDSFVSKPNPMMLRSAMNEIDSHSETTAMIGDRTDTDIVVEAGPTTYLVEVAAGAAGNVKDI